MTVTSVITVGKHTRISNLFALKYRGYLISELIKPVFHNLFGPSSLERSLSGTSCHMISTVAQRGTGEI